MNKKSQLGHSSIRSRKTGHPRKRSKVLSSRVEIGTLEELRKLYPAKTKDSEIINELVREKLARAQFDRWIATQQEAFKEEDFNGESLR